MRKVLFTKAILTVIAFLLAANLFSGANFFAVKNVVAADAGVFEVGKYYSFSTPNEQLGIGKILAIDENGWMKLSGFMPNTSQERIYLLNTKKITMAIESEKPKLLSK